MLTSCPQLDESWNPVVNVYRALHGMYHRPAAFATAWFGVGLRNMLWNFSYYFSVCYMARGTRLLLGGSLHDPLLMHAVNITLASAVAAAVTAPVDALRVQVLVTRPPLANIPYVLYDTVQTQRTRLWSSWGATVTRAAVGGVVFYGFYHHFCKQHPDWSDWLNHPSRLRNLAELTLYLTESVPTIEAPGGIIIRFLTNPFALFDDYAPEPFTMK